MEYRMANYDMSVMWEAPSSGLAVAGGALASSAADMVCTLEEKMVK